MKTPKEEGTGNQKSWAQQNKEATNAANSAKREQEKQFLGYIPYPKNEDIYAHDKLEEDIDPETRLPKAEVEVSEDLEKDVELDVPGAELDDADEAIGREDEENNYYSLGGDNHEDLEEDRNEVQ